MQPGLRIPLTGDPALFEEAVRLGREVIWLHTFGERFVDTGAGRPARAPRLAQGAPRIPADGAIPSDPEHMPDTISYDAANRRLWIGGGHIENVPPAVWAYEVSGKHVLTQWLSYRKRNRERPQIGERRTPSPFGDIQPDAWRAEYTTELLNLLNVLGRLVALEPAQADLLERICAGPILTEGALRGTPRVNRVANYITTEPELLAGFPQVCGRIARWVDRRACVGTVLRMPREDNATMAGDVDLFGHGPAQGSLFGHDDDRLQVPVRRYVPDPEKVRRRLKALLEKARSAEKMPWSERDARMWQTVFPNMANWLPADEAAQLRLEFAQEMDRLKVA